MTQCAFGHGTTDTVYLLVDWLRGRSPAATILRHIRARLTAQPPRRSLHVDSLRRVPPGKPYRSVYWCSVFIRRRHCPRNRLWHPHQAQATNGLIRRFFHRKPMHLVRPVASVRRRRKRRGLAGNMETRVVARAIALNVCRRGRKACIHGRPWVHLRVAIENAVGTVRAGPCANLSFLVRSPPFDEWVVCPAWGWRRGHDDAPGLWAGVDMRSPICARVSRLCSSCATGFRMLPSLFFKMVDTVDFLGYGSSVPFISTRSFGVPCTWGGEWLDNWDGGYKLST